MFQPEAFLATDEILRRLVRVVAGMVIDEAAIQRNMAVYGPFAATERVLMALVAAGASRQEGHEWIRACSLQAWAALRDGQANPLASLLATDPQISRYLPPEKVQALMIAEAHVGTAPGRALSLAQTIRHTL